MMQKRPLKQNAASLIVSKSTKEDDFHSTHSLHLRKSPLVAGFFVSKIYHGSGTKKSNQSDCSSFVFLVAGARLELITFG